METEILLMFGVRPRIPSKRNDDIREKGIKENDSGITPPSSSKIHICISNHIAILEYKPTFIIWILSSLSSYVTYKILCVWAKIH